MLGRLNEVRAICFISAGRAKRGYCELLLAVCVELYCREDFSLSLFYESKMSDAAVAPAKVTKKRAAGSAKAKKPADHPTYAEMIKSALGSLKVCMCVLCLAHAVV